MRSQSLFNFFTKAAEVRKCAGGPQVFKGTDAEQYRKSMRAAGDARYNAELQRRTNMTPEQRWDEELGYSLRNHGDPKYGGSVRSAYSHYINNMRDKYGKTDADQFYAARSYARSRLAEDQFNKMWDAYHTYTSPGLYGNNATSSSRMNSRMIGDNDQANYIFTPNSDDRGWNPANMTYAEFGKFFTGADGKMMSREEALSKWNNSWQARYDRGSNGRNGTEVGVRPAAGTTDESWRANGFRQQRQLHDDYAKRKADKANPASLTFKGGHTVSYNPEYVTNWNRATEPTNNNVGGTWYTDEQYMAYKDIYGQLVSSMTGSGIPQAQAKAEASRLAKSYINDQMTTAAGGNARNEWMQPAAPVTPTGTPGTSVPVVQPKDSAGATPAPTGVSVLPFLDGDNPLRPLTAGSSTPGTLTIGGGITYPDDGSTMDAAGLPNVELPTDYDSNTNIRVTPSGTLEYYNPGTNSTPVGSTLHGATSNAVKMLNTSNKPGTNTPSALSTTVTLPGSTGANGEVYTPKVPEGQGEAPVNSNAAPVDDTSNPQQSNIATTTPTYEAGFAHTSEDDFKRNFGETATYDTLLEHYGNHAWNNMRNLQTRITELRRAGLGGSAECKRLVDQFVVARKRYTSIIHAREDMSQNELNGMYMPGKFDWIFDAANDSSDYWKANHTFFGSGPHGRRDYLNAMPEDLANFNTLW